MKQTIKTGQFVTINDDEFKKYGVSKGDLLYLAGDIIVVIREEDPYTLRRIFIAAFMNGDYVDQTKQPFIVDATRVTPVSEKEQARLTAMHEEANKGE